MTINAAIVDDNPQAISALETLLREYCSNINIIGTATNLEEANHLLRHPDINIAFLDIEMHEQRTIFDLLDGLSKDDLLHYEIVFVTGHQEANYAFKAIELMALGYLFKPVDGNKLKAAVDRVDGRLTMKSQRLQLQSVLSMIGSQNQNQSMSIQLSKGDILIVRLEEIRYIKGDGPITEFFLIDKQVKSVRGLGYYTSILEGHPNFHKFSQGLLVNTHHMERYNHRDLEIKMRDGKLLEASRRGGQAFRNKKL